MEDTRNLTAAEATAQEEEDTYWASYHDGSDWDA